MKKNTRPDNNGTHRAQYDRNKKIIYATQTICGICGKPVDFKNKYPHPMSACVDHIVPISRGGHPSDMDNLQLAHWACNRQKSDKLMRDGVAGETNRDFPQSMNWTTYRAKG